MGHSKQPTAHIWPAEFTLQINSTYKQVSILVRKTAAWLDSCKTDDDASADCCIVLAEAANNVVKHGYGGQKQGKIFASVHLTQNDIRVTVKDFGRPYLEPPCTAPVQWKTVKPNALPESGFGWEILRYITYNIELNRENSCNTLTMCLRLNETASLSR